MKENRKLLNLKRRSFYYIAILIPIVQFLIFYLFVNINSILLAFKDYDLYTGTYTIVWFDNLRKVFSELLNRPAMSFAIKNTFILFLSSTIVGISLPLLFSYYIFKKGFLSGTFQVVLYLPSIISSLAFVLMYKYFVELAVPEIFDKLFAVKIDPLLSTPASQFGTILFYSLWTCFGVNIILYSNAMSGISKSIIEAAQLDGVNAFQEFLLIIIPRIYSTIVVFVVIGVSGMFINQMNLFNFYGTSAEAKLWTIGYFLYKEIASQRVTIADYPYLAAYGLVFTMFAVVITFTVKFVMEKLGPKDE